MHYQLEVILPPGGTTLDEDLALVMDSFREEQEDGDDAPGTADWYDWWEIGGRWSGNHALAHVEPALLAAFREELHQRKVTVSGIQFGKQELSPATQIPEVDRLWREMVPRCGNECPLFQHSKPTGDVCLYSEVSGTLKAKRVIICERREAGGIRVRRMVVTSLWNGTEHQKTDFDGNVRAFVEAQRMSESGWPKPVDVKDDWVAVTIDYHN